MKLAIVTGILAAGLGGYLQDQDPEKRIAELVQQLSSDDFETREKASAELKKIGAPAIPALREASKSKDPETRMRAETILEALKKKPAPTPRRKRSSGPRVLMQSRNGDSIYTLTPSEGDPITFHKRSNGSVRLEYIDEEGKDAEAVAGSLEAFLKKYPDLSKKFGISRDGIKYGDARTSFNRGFSFKFVQPEEFERGFGDLEEELRKRLEGFRKFFDDPGRFSLPDNEDFFGRGNRREAKSIHGAVLLPVPGSLRAHVTIPRDTGLMVSSVETDTLAWRFGFKKYDILLKVGKKPLRSAQDVKELLNADEPVTILRKGKEVVRRVEY